MSVTFLHTADWQLGKPFAAVEDGQKRALLQQGRLNVLDRLASVAKECGAEFVLVAGDVFDSPRATKATVAAACSAIGVMGCPVYVIPGNHDHGGPGSLWEQPFFLQEQTQRAPNLQVLLKPEPVELDSVVLLPCPLLHRQDFNDPTAWIRARREELEAFGDKPRLVIAHGSTQGFGGQADDEDTGCPAGSNLIDLSRLPNEAIDYVALGDWHGMKQVGAKAWYAGTPELDRFRRGDSNAPGHVLKVTVSRGREPQVTPVPTARLGWHELSFDFLDDSGVGQLEEKVEALIGGRANHDLLLLELRGALGIAATTRLEQLLESWQARLLRLKLYNETVLAPAEEELVELSQQMENPLISSVAGKLVARAREAGDDAAVARVALRELHALCAVS